MVSCFEHGFYLLKPLQENLASEMYTIGTTGIGGRSPPRFCNYDEKVPFYFWEFPPLDIQLNKKNALGVLCHPPKI